MDAYIAHSLSAGGGEGGIRTLGTPYGVQRFSRPPRSTAPAPLRGCLYTTYEVFRKSPSPPATESATEFPPIPSIRSASARTCSSVSRAYRSVVTTEECPRARCSADRFPPRGSSLECAVTCGFQSSASQGLLADLDATARVDL